MNKSRMIRRMLLLIVLSAITLIIVIWSLFFSPVKAGGEGIDIYIGRGAIYEDVKDSLRVRALLTRLMLSNQSVTAGQKSAKRYSRTGTINKSKVTQRLRHL